MKKTCPECTATFTDGRPDKVYCCESCRKKAEKKRHRQIAIRPHLKLRSIVSRESVVCNYCQHSFLPAGTGRKPKFCSDECREASRRKRKLAEPTGRFCLGCGCELSYQAKYFCGKCVADPDVYIGRIEERPCAVCGKLFRPKIDARVCCSEECGKRYGGQITVALIDETILSKCEICGDEFHPRLVQVDQKTCGKNKCRRRLDNIHKEKTGKRRDINARRRAVTAGVEAERINVLAVFERDGWICQICSKPVDPLLAHPHPLSKSLDHIVPLSRGGGHVWENVQLAHFVCNLSKGNRLCQEEGRPSRPN